MKYYGILLLTGGICMGLFSACAKQAPETYTKAGPFIVQTSAASAVMPVSSLPNALSGEDTGTMIEDPVVPSAVTRIIFDYDNYSGDQFMIRAVIDPITAKGGTMEVEKRVGPMNYTGHKKEGIVQLDHAQMEELLEILGRYDIKGYSRLRKKGYSASPSRSVWVFEGDERYVVSFDTEFPETLPPQEDIMYFELFRFFNDILNNEPGWEEVRSENLEDPRENPAYGERYVKHFGRKVRLVPGTGIYHDDGYGALIDYGDRKWWVEEGFTGIWTMSAEDREALNKTNNDATLTVKEDGQAVLELDGEVWKGRLAADRYYKKGVAAGFDNENGEHRSCEISLLNTESYDHLRIRCYPGPVPEPQFYPIDITLTRNNRKAPISEDQDTILMGADIEQKDEKQNMDKKSGTWTCENCGAENTALFCLTCGSPGPSYQRTIKEGKWPEDGHFPTLKEVRAKEEKHGPLTEFEWSGSSSGMMAGSISKYSMRLYRENGELRMEDMEMKTYEPVITKTYAVDEAIYKRLKNIVEKENLAAWSYLRVDRDKQMIIYDYSSSSHLTLVFDDSAFGERYPVRRSIDYDAVSQQDGTETWTAVTDLLRECEQPDKLLKETSEPNPYAPNGIPGLGMMTTDPLQNISSQQHSGPGPSEIAEDGSWTCGFCGASGNRGKFCAECGSPKQK